MSASVSLSELLDALEWVSASGPFENAAHISRETGRIFWQTDADNFEEEPPGDLEDETLYVCVPNKQDLDLGQRLVLRFVGERVPDAYERVRAYFGRRGAYGRLKDMLERRGLLQAWYAYERAAAERALREWAAAQGLNVHEGSDPS